jgi:hypothetical protein
MPNTFKLQKCKCEEKGREETRENGIYYLHGRLPIFFLSYARDVQRCEQPTNQRLSQRPTNKGLEER